MTVLQEEKTRTQDEKTTSNYWIAAIVIIVIFLAVIWFRLRGQPKNQEPKKRVRTDKQVQKAELFNYYGVDKKTLAKWVEFFCHDQIKDYPKKRRLTTAEHLCILTHLGWIEIKPILTKFQIAEMSDSNTDTLRRWVIENGEKIGVSLTAYDSLNLFPPIISDMLLLGFKNESLEVVYREYSSHLANAA